VPEIRRLLHLLEQDAMQAAFHRHWARWRRAHQWQARQAQVRRRTRQVVTASSAAAVSLDLLPAPTCIAGLPRLTPSRWERIARLLPPQRPPTGRPASDYRQMLEGMLWVMAAGTAWRQMPNACGPGQTVYARFQRWKREGLWEQVRRILLSIT
jgi:Putative transposase of IS4/5 family (DUF4096)